MTVNHLWSAYTGGIFPWPVEENYVLWFSPPTRAVLLFDEFRVSKSIKRDLKKCEFKFTYNQQFSEVIRLCALQKRKEEGTWITDKVIKAYEEFHRLGYAVSCEVLDDEEKLVGGLYGVKLGDFFAGESMFNHVNHAAKFALIKMVDYLRENYQVTWLDSQVLNPFMARFGVKEVPREQYMEMLNNCDFAKDKAL